MELIWKLTRLLWTCGQTAPSLTARSVPVGREEEDSSLTPRMNRKKKPLLFNRTAPNPLMFVQVIVRSRSTEFGYSHNAAGGDGEFLSFLVVLATNTLPPRVLKEPPRTNTSGYSRRWLVSTMATIIKGALCGFWGRHSNQTRKIFID